MTNIHTQLYVTRGEAKDFRDPERTRDCLQIWLPECRIDTIRAATNVSKGALCCANNGTKSWNARSGLF